LGTSAVSSGTGINAGMGTVPLWIGGQPNCNTGAQAGTTAAQTGTVQHAFTGIWDYALPDTELSSVQSLLQSWGTKYGRSF
ncbi:hypothetical protein, partial [Gluconobacter vitians]